MGGDRYSRQIWDDGVVGTAMFQRDIMVALLGLPVPRHGEQCRNKRGWVGIYTVDGRWFVAVMMG